jgi:hypothetical protein
VTETYRKGTLYFFNNTVVYRVDREQQYHGTVFDLETNDETVEIWNNIFHLQSETPGTDAVLLFMARGQGVLRFDVNPSAPTSPRRRSVEWDESFAGSVVGWDSGSSPWQRSASTTRERRARPSSASVAVDAGVAPSAAHGNGRARAVRASRRRAAAGRRRSHRPRSVRSALSTGPECRPIATLLLLRSARGGSTSGPLSHLCRRRSVPTMTSTAVKVPGRTRLAAIVAVVLVAGVAVATVVRVANEPLRVAGELFVVVVAVGAAWVALTTTKARRAIAVVVLVAAVVARSSA